MKKLLWFAVSVAFASGAFAVEYQGRVITVEAFRHGGTNFVLEQVSPDGRVSPDRLMLTSSSLVVQGVLLRAFITSAVVKVETEGQTPIIHRVNAFAPGDGPRATMYGEYRLSRLATQRTQAGDHLEVFLKRGGDSLTLNVVDPALQPLFLTVFEAKRSGASGLPIQLTYSDGIVTSVRLGDR
jgi:hypothetical protein